MKKLITLDNAEKPAIDEHAYCQIKLDDCSDFQTANGFAMHTSYMHSVVKHEHQFPNYRSE